MPIDYYGKLKEVVEYYNANPRNIQLTSVDPKMFDDSDYKDKLNDGDVIKAGDVFAIVTGSGQGRVILSKISPTSPNELQQIGSFEYDEIPNSYKVTVKTVGGVIMKKSKKSRKSRKSKKSRKARKSRKM